jgi:hypothetical protein
VKSVPKARALIAYLMSRRPTRRILYTRKVRLRLTARQTEKSLEQRNTSRSRCLESISLSLRWLPYLISELVELPVLIGRYPADKAWAKDESIRL